MTKHRERTCRKCGKVWHVSSAPASDKWTPVENGSTSKKYICPHCAGKRTAA